MTPQAPALAQTASALIELRQVVKTFKNAAGTFTVLKGIDASFQAGEFASIVGRSGSGKSTLLNMITGIDHPTSGVVRIGPAELHTMSEGRMSVWRGKNLGIVFQFFQLLPMLTLLENVMLPMDFCDVYAPQEREGRAQMLLAMVGLGGLEHKYPAAVSGGQQQSAAVARALANDPPILIADEPTGNLDSRTAERVLEIFEEQVAEGKTVLMVTHDNSLAQRAARRLVIIDGELIFEPISNAFPELPHHQLLELSRCLEPVAFAPGGVIARGDSGPDLLLITRGTVEVVVSGRWRSQVSAGVLGPGDWISREDMRLGRPTLAGLRALEAVEGLAAPHLPALAELETVLAEAAQERLPAWEQAAKRRGEGSRL
jgi:putative ABC transport system ATP-binding protein